jgi:hypothetical protein
MTAARFRPPRNDTHSRGSTAYHEAGHAIIALTIGRPVKSVDIYERTKGSWSGHVITGPADPNAEPFVARCLNDLVIDFAGPVAQKRACPQSRLDWFHSWDLDNARDTVALVSASEESRPALLRWARKEAEYRVRQNWPAITAVARVLAERQYLTGEDVARIKAEVEAVWAEARAKVRDVILADPEIKRQARLPWYRRRTVSRRMIADAVLTHLIETGSFDPEQFNQSVRAVAIAREYDPQAAVEKLLSLAKPKEISLCALV